jgi:2-C-methyl-D-erythritol 4-phosphate cytidylyltransferase
MNEHLAVIIVAAGTGSRMESAERKQFIHINGIPLIAMTISAFDRRADVAEIIVVSHPDEIERVRTEIIVPHGFKKVNCIVPGGEQRKDSVKAGLRAVSETAAYIAVHDGARPFVTSGKLDLLFRRAFETGAAILAVPLTDTIKRTDDAGMIERTISRNGLWAAQTPQVFRADWVQSAYHNLAQRETPTDDAAVLEQAGYPVHIVPGSWDNFKITVADDVVRAEIILKHRENQA